MSWQEELRNLDEELASGRLSADDYRVRRDQVLSSAVAYGDSGQQQAQAPQQPAQQQYQQPQAPQQNQQNPPQPSADSTQIIAPVNPPQPNAESTQIVSSADVAPERTQVVNSWQQQHADPNRTQVVPNSPAGGFQQPHSPAGGFQQPQQYQQQPAWNAPDQDVAPPWGGSDFPPIAPAGSSEWVKQGPEVFEDRTGRGKGGKIAVMVVVALLVLAGLGIGGYFLFKPGGTTDTQESTAAPAPTSQPSPAPKPKSPMELLLEKIPNPSGEPDPKNNVLGVGQLVGTSVLEQGEVDILTAAGVKEVAWKGSQKQPDEFGPQPAKISVMVIPVGSAAGATELLKQLRAYQANNGFTLISEPLPEMPESVSLHKKTGDTSGIYRGTWVSGDNVIRVSIDQQFPTDKIEDEKALSGSYQRAVKKTLTPFPAS
ncbi:flagellar basal body-associated protein FliL [Amycolatopsis sp. NPDC059657]|uniref:flagellar basal body-associated protein FliL n=1 Tax=Amycolatopsis sp. NPDC059657 TaxID=3346899 RepID=UPI00366E74B8